MTISQTTLLLASANRETRASLTEAKGHGIPTAFLSHSHKDAKLALGLSNHLHSKGWDIYIDWRDTAMPDPPNRETAARIRGKIVEMNYFLFLATENSMTSRWCPWELGYADGKKDNKNILIVPTSSQSGRTFGSEYLELYRRIDIVNESVAAIAPNGGSTILRGAARL